jgi:hypothetical protein
MAQGRRLAGGPDGHEAVHAPLDLALDQADEGGLIDLIVPERGYEGRKDAPEQGIGHGMQKTVRTRPLVAT